MDPQLKKGILDVLILRYLIDKDSYGYEIISNLTKHIELSESTLYPVLKRLEEQNCLKVFKEEHHGRLRKYYSITKEGEKKLDKFKKEYPKLKNTFDYIVEGDKK